MNVELEQFVSTWGLRLGVGGLILFMAFIVWDLARKHDAGRFGTAILFLALGLGVLGYLIKVVITYLIDHDLL